MLFYFYLQEIIVALVCSINQVRGHHYHQPTMRALMWSMLVNVADSPSLMLEDGLLACANLCGSRCWKGWSELIDCTWCLLRARCQTYAPLWLFSLCTSFSQFYIYWWKFQHKYKIQISWVWAFNLVLWPHWSPSSPRAQIWCVFPNSSSSQLCNHTLGTSLVFPHRVSLSHGLWLSSATLGSDVLF